MSLLELVERCRRLADPQLLVTEIPYARFLGIRTSVADGGLLTVLGLAIFAGLYPRPLDEHYSPRFSSEEFGVVVNCEDRDVAEVESLMRGHNAKEVTLAASH